MSARLKIVGACVSDRGVVREKNEDAIFFEVLPHRKQAIAVGAVFDGVGGLEHGEFASSFLKEEMQRWTVQLKKNVHGKYVDPEILFAHFKDEAELLNEKLFAWKEQKHLRMASTMSAILIVDWNYLIIQVGDSRIYRIGQYFEQLTEDEIRYEETETRYIHKLTNYVGKTDELEFLSYQGTIDDGDMFLFCSDGGYHHLLESDFVLFGQVKNRQPDLEGTLEELVRRLIARGERDNISLGLLVCKG
jgi:serine/threonine protein phosphatase PrpC